MPACWRKAGKAPFNLLAAEPRAGSVIPCLDLAGCPRWRFSFGRHGAVCFSTQCPQWPSGQRGQSSFRSTRCGAASGVRDTMFGRGTRVGSSRGISARWAHRWKDGRLPPARRMNRRDRCPEAAPPPRPRQRMEKAAAARRAAIFSPRPWGRGAGGWGPPPKERSLDISGVLERTPAVSPPDLAPPPLDKPERMMYNSKQSLALKQEEC